MDLAGFTRYIPTLYIPKHIMMTSYLDFGTIVILKDGKSHWAIITVALLLLGRGGPWASAAL